MKYLMVPVLVLLVLLFWVFGLAAAQDSCPEIVSRAIDMTGNVCENTALNQACYGHYDLQATMRFGYEGQPFNVPGNKVALQGVEKIVHEPMNIATGQWGVALMKLQANLPDTLPGQAVAVMTLGNTEVETQVGPGGVVQGFFFQSGIGDSPCREIPSPQSGIMINTPHGVGKVLLSVNNVSLAISSMVFLQALPGTNSRTGFVDINVLEGEVEADVAGSKQIATDGLKIRVPLDQNLQPVGYPSPPEPFDPALHVELQHVSEVIRQVNHQELVQPVSTESCTVEAKSSAALRTGPSTNRANFANLVPPLRLEVLGVNDDWFFVNKNQVEGGHNALQLWVHNSQVNTFGNCSALEFVDPAAPVMPKPQPRPTPIPEYVPGPAPTEELLPVPAPPQYVTDIQFWADDTHIDSYECTHLNVSGGAKTIEIRIYSYWEPVAFDPDTTPVWSTEVCPSHDTTYALRFTRHEDNVMEERYITVHVD